MEASAASGRFGWKTLRDAAQRLRLDKARVLMLCPLLLSFIVWRDVPEVFFVSDDFIDMKNIANEGVIDFFVSPFAGHMIFTRNVAVILLYVLFGPDQPEAYGWVILLTHLVNVALLFRAARVFAGSVELAALVASIWGTCPLYAEALTWPAVYGVLLCATFLLLVLNGVAARQADGAALSVRSALLWSLLLLMGATCFGGGIAVALIFPFLVFLLFDAPQRPRRAFVAIACLPVVVLGLYFGTQWIYAYFDAVPVDQKMIQALALVDWKPPVQMFTYLLAVGSSGLLRGFAFSPDGYPHIVWWLTAAFAVAVAGVLRFGDKMAWRRVVVLAALAGVSYAMIAIGRANVYKMFGVSSLEAARQLRYHYLSTVPLALLLAVPVGVLARRLRSEIVPGAALGCWVLLAAYLYAKNPWSINTHADCRQYVDSALAEIDRKVDAGPVGSEVRIPNQELPRYCTGIFGYDAIPGWATLFSISRPDNELRGRRVVFVEDVYHRRSGRLAKLIVPESRDTETRVDAASPHAENVPASRYSPCRELQDAFARLRKLRGCGRDDWANVKAFCEAPFEAKPACMQSFLKSHECLLAQPASEWRCDENGLLNVGTLCLVEMRPLIQCLNE